LRSLGNGKTPTAYPSHHHQWTHCSRNSLRQRRHP
jgi:hypothetical protein